MSKPILGVFFALILVLGGCTAADKRVEGYQELRSGFCQEASESYDEVACAKVRLYDTLATFRELQTIKNSLFMNPNVPQDLKDAVEIAEDNAVVALRQYTDAVIAGQAPTQATIQAALSALTAFQAVLLQMEQEA